MTFTPNPVKEQGGVVKADTTNATVESTLCQILKQLQIMNLHLSIINDTIIDKTEI